ncbi:MAG: ABC transporter ATP-binding protein [Candidatus Micrarchaeaceae archaeon]
MITVTKVHKTYGRKETAYEALRGIDLAIKDGESIAIIGKSGSGKSTLMHLLAGLDHPSTGSIQWDDISLAEMSENKLANLRNRRIGFVFQQFFLQPTLTVLENAVLPLKIGGTSPSVRKSRGRAALEAVGLLDKADNRATDLSGGQRQRVAIARALINNPAVIFADEPTGNLDTETGQQITELLFRLHKDREITLVIVTHDSELARRCDRVIHIQDGKVVK